MNTRHLLRAIIAWNAAWLFSTTPCADACTTAVISGRATCDGRPILWKNRDTSQRHNEMVLLTGGKYRVLAVVNAAQRSSVWMGVNSAGLCIENSLSTDLRTDEEAHGPGNGRIMKEALQTCASVDDVYKLLERTNESGRTTNGNFGVIDALGGAALFEVGPNSFSMFDANDPDHAPHGIIVRTNFATTARHLPANPPLEDLPEIYSSKRFLQACRRLHPRVDDGIDAKFVIRNLTRDLSDDQGRPVPGSINAPERSLPAFIPTDATISRTTTVSAAVFQGVLPGEDPRLTTMWAILGDPKFSIAVPCWASMDTLADPMYDDKGAEIGEIALTLRGWSLNEAGNGINTSGLPGIWNDLWPVEDRIFSMTERAMEGWRASGYTTSELTDHHYHAATRAMRAMQGELRDLKKAILEPIELESTRSDEEWPALRSDGSHAELGGTPIRVGVYDDVGTGRSIEDLIRALRAMDGVSIRRLTANDIRAGQHQELDLLIHPGGSGSQQAKQLGADGRQAIRRFVRTGGGFVGFCAGAYLASAQYSWSLDLLDARVLDRAHWARGSGRVDIRLTAPGRKLFAVNQPNTGIHYGQGPLLVPARDDSIPDYVPLATYQTEITQNGAPEGVMEGTTAIAAGEFGRGRVVCFSPHPEMTEGLESFVHRAVEHVRRESRAPLCRRSAPQAHAGCQSHSRHLSKGTTEHGILRAVRSGERRFRISCDWNHRASATFCDKPGCRSGRHPPARTRKVPGQRRPYGNL